MKTGTRLRISSFGLICLAFVLAPAISNGMQEENNTESSTQSCVVDRADIIAFAQRYAEHTWTAQPENVFHGLDKKGSQVDTPDSSYRKNGFLVGETNVGIPYKWGGFSSIEQFDAGIRDGKFAGHLPNRGSARSSLQAVGVDCSGLVSRCWDLPRKHSTRSIGNLCYQLDSYADLEPGDIINSFDGHVVIFESFVDEAKTSVVVYEAGGTRVKKSEYPVSRLKKNGFKPLRYKPLDKRWVPMELAPANLGIVDLATSQFVEGDEESPEFAELDNSLNKANRGDWARYQTETGEESLRSISNINADSVVIRTRLSKAGKVQLNERRSTRDNSLMESLVHFGGFDQDFSELQLEDSQIALGRFKFDGKSVVAQRIKLDVRASLLIRGTTYPASIQIDCLVSDEVALLGVITCQYSITLSQGDEIVGKNEKRLTLLDCHKG